MSSSLEDQVRAIIAIPLLFILGVSVILACYLVYLDWRYGPMIPIGGEIVWCNQPGQNNVHCESYKRK